MHASQALTTSLPYNYISAPRDLNFVPRTNRSHELGTVRFITCAVAGARHGTSARPARPVVHSPRRSSEMAADMRRLRKLHMWVHVLQSCLFSPCMIGHDVKGK